MGLVELAEELRRAAEDALLSGLKPERRAKFKDFFRSLELFAATGLDLLGRARPGTADEELARAKSELANAADDAARAKAAAKLSALVAAKAGESSWKTLPVSELSPYDVLQVPVLSPPLSSAGKVASAKAAPSGETVVVVGDFGAKVLLWDGARYEESPLPARPAEGSAFAVSADGRAVALFDETGSFVELWRSGPERAGRTYRLVGRIPLSSKGGNALLLDGEGATLVALLSDGSAWAHRWDGRSLDAEGLRRYEALALSPPSVAGAGLVTSAAVSEDGTTLALGTFRDARVLRWDGRSYRPAWRSRESSPTLSLSRDGGTLLCIQNNTPVVWLWDGKEGPDGGRVYAQAWRDETVKVTGYSARLSADGTKVLVGTDDSEALLLGWDGKTSPDGRRSYRRALAVPYVRWPSFLGFGPAGSLFLDEKRYVPALAALGEAGKPLLLESGAELALGALGSAVPVLSPPPQPWPQALTQGQAAYELAYDERGRAQARAALSELLLEHAGELRWDELPALGLKPSDIAQVLARSQNLSASKPVALAATPSGETVAVRGPDDVVRVFAWDGARYAEVWAKKFPAERRATLALSGDGRLLALGSDWNGVQLYRWDGSGAKGAARDYEAAPAPKSSLGISLIALDGDGSTLVGSNNEKAEAFRWDGASWSRVWESAFILMGGSESGVRALALSLDGRTLAAAAGASGLQVLGWDGAAYRPAWTSRSWTNRVCLTPDGRALLAVYDGGYADAEVFAWDGAVSATGSREYRTVWRGLTGAHSGLLSPDARSFLLGTASEVRLLTWDGVSLDGEGLREYRPAWRKRRVRAQSEPNTAVTARPVDALAWGAEPGTLLLADQTLDSYSGQPALLADAETLVTLPGGVLVARQDLLAPLRVLRLPEKPWPLELRQARAAFDGALDEAARRGALDRLAALLKTHAAELRWKDALPGEVSPLDVVRVLAEKETLTSSLHKTRLAASPSGETVVVFDAVKAARVLVWDGERYEQKGEIRAWANDLAPGSLAVSGDGMTIAVGGEIWSLEGGALERVGKVEGYRQLSHLAFDRSGRVLVALGRDTGITRYSWDGSLKDGERRYVPGPGLKAGTSDAFLDLPLALTPDGSILTAQSVKGARVFQWDGVKYEEVWRLGSRLFRAVPSADGRALLLVGARTSLLRWDGRSLDERGRRVYEEVWGAPLTTIDGVLSGDQRKILLRTEQDEALLFEWDGAARSEGLDDYRLAWRKPASLAAGWGPLAGSVLLGSAADGVVLHAPRTAIAGTESFTTLEDGLVVGRGRFPGTVRALDLLDKPWPQLLASARTAHERAEGDQARRAALARMKALLAGAAGELVWDEKQGGAVRDLDVVKALMSLQTLSPSRDARLLAATPDGRFALHAVGRRVFLLARGDGGRYERVWERLLENGDVPTSGALSPDGRRILLGTRSGMGIVYERSGEGEKLVFRESIGFDVRSVAFAEEGGLILALARSSPAEYDDAFAVRAYRLDAGEPSFVRKLLGRERSHRPLWTHPLRSRRADFFRASADGRTVVVGEGTKAVLLAWDGGAKSPPREEPLWSGEGDDRGHTLTAVDLSADGQLVALGFQRGSGSGEVRILKTGMAWSRWGLVDSLARAGSPVSSLSFSPDGRRLLVASGSRALLLERGEEDGETVYDPRWEKRFAGTLGAALMDAAGEGFFFQVEGSGLHAAAEQTLFVAGEDSVVSLETGEAHPRAELPDRLKVLRVDAQAWPQELAKARAAFDGARDAKARSKALRDLQALVSAHDEDIPWELTKASALKDLQLAKGFAAGQRLWSRSSNPSALAATPDGRLLLRSDGRTVRLHRRDGNGVYQEFWSGSAYMLNVQSVSLSPDGSRLLFATRELALIYEAKGEGYELVGKIAPKLPEGADISGAALAADGKTVLLGIGARGSMKDPLAAAALGLYAYRWDGAAMDNDLRVFAPLWHEKHAQRIESFSASSDLGTIALRFGDGSGLVLRWDGRARPSPEVEQPRGVVDMKVSPDGARVLIIGGRDARLLRRDGGGFKTSWSKEAAGDERFTGGALGEAEDRVLLYSRWTATLYRGEKAVARRRSDTRMGLALLLPEDTFLLPYEDGQGTKVFRPRTMLIKDARTFVSLDSGEELSRELLGEDLAALPESSPAEALRAGFKPAYGEKPFYFAAGADGRVQLNFKGRWFETRHRLMEGVDLSARETVLGAAGGRKLLRLEDLRRPYGEAARALSSEDFLLEGPVLEAVEASLLSAFKAGWAVNLYGNPGGGKTSISREAALLLGLPVHVFQMHGERELSDLIGGYREDARGRMRLSSLPWKDAEGRTRFALPLLDMAVNGGVFVLDEGAIGERGRELLSWFSAMAARDKELVISEFPGRELKLKVHPDFHLVITNNDPEQTAGRSSPKSELASALHALYVDEDESPESLARYFGHFLGEAPVSEEDRLAYGQAVAALHHQLKPLIGKELGKDSKERHYLSKREVRRVAGMMRRALLEDPRAEPRAVFYRALRLVYEAQFAHPAERALAHQLFKPWLSHMDEVLRAADAALFPGAPTEEDARVSAALRRLLLEDEPVLLLTERGARADAMLKAAAASLDAGLDVVDAAPEHGTLELLGGRLPLFGKRPEGSPRARLVRGRLSAHLATLAELETLAAGEPRPAIVWLRNVDQWKEEVRTALNGLLEDGYVDLEDESGGVVRLYKPPHVRFVAEMPTDSTAEFSSAFFNRWLKVGVAAERPGADIRAVLRRVHGAGALEARWLDALYKILTETDRLRGWANRGDHRFGPGILYATASALKRRKAEDPRWRALLAACARAGYDPFEDPDEVPSGREQRRLRSGYRALLAEAFAAETRRLLGARLTSEARHTALPDLERFEKMLAIVLGGKPLPAAAASLTTKDGTQTALLTAADGVPVKTGAGALSLGAAARAAGLELNDELRRKLALLARADSLGRATALVGETGAAKTSVAHLWSLLTGRRFYKYQSHAGSEVADLTIDIEQEESGEFRKRVKELYRLLREGDVVIDIDEANVAPWVLWSLEPLLRGEAMVHPIFPEEPPFRVGEGVQLVLTFNPERYSARSRIDARLLERMLVAWQDLPRPEDAARIVETFYGVHETPATETPALLPAVVEEAALEPAPKAEKTAALKPLGLESRAGTDRLMRKGQEVIDKDKKAPSGELKGSGRAGVFTPDLFPHTRLEAVARWDEASGEFVRDGAGLALLEVPSLSDGQVEAALRELAATHDAFEGRVELELGPEWRLVPSAGPDMEILRLKAADKDGKELPVKLELAKDEADNYYVRSDRSDRAVLRYTVAVPAAYFGAPVPSGLPFAYPAAIPSDVRAAMKVIGLSGAESDFREVLHALVGYFRDFKNVEDGIKSHGGSLYLDIVRSKVGVCRHRGFAFTRTLLGLGIPARYVLSESDAHAYAEVKVPGLGWLRVDLGGGGDPMNEDLSSQPTQRHAERHAGDLPTPENYLKTAEEYARRLEEARTAQGLEPRQPSEQAGGGKGGGGGGSEDARVEKELARLRAALAVDAKLNDELSALFEHGRGDTEFVFDRMLRALNDKVRVWKKRVKRGLELDIVAFILKKPKMFVRRVKEQKLQTTAVSILLDFSGSMSDVKRQLSYTIAAVGENFRKLRETAPQHFFYDLSSFTERAKTVIAMGERVGESENAERLVSMANSAGSGGTSIVGSMRTKLKDFLDSREARSAKVKYVVVFTDGADHGTVATRNGERVLTEEMQELMAQYRAAGIDVIAIGIGQGAKDVTAFDGPGLHHVRVGTERSEDIAESIAKLAELKSKGAGHLPPGSLNALLQIK